MRSTVLWIDVKRLLENRYRIVDGSCVLAPQLWKGAHHEIVGLKARWRLARRCFDLGTLNRRFKRAGDLHGDQILKRKNLSGGSLISRGPQLCACHHIDELHGDS